MYNNQTAQTYSELNKQLHNLLTGETNNIANLANASSLLNNFLHDVNWVGFYIYQKETDTLVLGPFQGNPACVTIQNGKGVCGTAFRGNDVFIVDNVHEFPGHIACDARTNSEIVVPIYIDGKPFGVLDIDSESYERFDETDRLGLIEFVNTLKQHLKI